MRRVKGTPKYFISNSKKSRSPGESKQDTDRFPKSSESQSVCRKHISSIQNSSFRVKSLVDYDRSTPRTMAPLKGTKLQLQEARAPNISRTELFDSSNNGTPSQSLQREQTSKLVLDFSKQTARSRASKLSKRLKTDVSYNPKFDVVFLRTNVSVSFGKPLSNSGSLAKPHAFQLSEHMRKIFSRQGLENNGASQ